MGLKSNEHQSRAFEIYTKTERNDFTLIAKHFTESEIVCIKNTRFRPNGKLSAIASENPKINANAEHVNVSKIRNCFQIKEILIKILKTKNSSVPCLR